MSQSVSLTFPDGNVREFAAGTTGKDVAESISKSLAKKSVAIAIDGVVRDLSDPELWVERFHVATWLDYVRHNQRRTRADEANSETLQALRIAGYEPVVHRRIERQTGGALPFRRAPDPAEMEPMTDPTRSS